MLFDAFDSSLGANNRRKNIGTQVQTVIHTIKWGDRMKIISMIYYNGKWVPQEEIPKEKLHEQVKKVLTRAGKNIGLSVQKVKSA